MPVRTSRAAPRVSTDSPFAIGSTATLPHALAKRDILRGVSSREDWQRRLGPLYGGAVALVSSTPWRWPTEVSEDSRSPGWIVALGIPVGFVSWLVAMLVHGAGVPQQISGVFGVAMLTAASAMQTITISTMNFQTFAELAFSFTLTPRIVVASLAFALLMGFVGGFLPAVRAARLKIVDALRAA